MGQDSGDLVVIMGKGDDLSADVHPASGDAEGIHLRQINEVKAELQMGRGQVLDQFIAKVTKMPTQLVILNDVDVQRDCLGHSVAQVNFLLIGKHVFGGGNRLQRGRQG